MFTLFSFYCCEQGQACYWDLATTSTFTIYSTFLFTNLLLISKGFYIIKDYLNRKDMTFIAISMGGIYLGFSVYNFDKTKLVFLLFGMLCVLFYLFLRFTTDCIKKLILKHSELSSNDVQILIPAVVSKIRMYKLYYKVLCVYLIEKIIGLSLLWLISNFENVTEEYFFISSIIDEITELTSIVLISLVFRARFRGVFFNLNISEYASEVLRFIGFYKAKVPKSFNTYITNNYPLLLIKPKGKYNFSYQNFLIGNPGKNIKN